MAFSTRPRPRRGLRLVVAGAVMLTALTTATAAASPQTPMGVSAPERPRLGTAAPSSRPGASTRPRTPGPGFLLERGRYTRIAAPGAVTTTAVGINNRTQVVGQYQDEDGIFHGYVWERGRFTTIDVPGQPGTTAATGINNRGQITGGTGPFAARVGFLLDRGRFTTFTIPGAQVTLAYGINDQGQIVGHSISGPPTAPTISGFLRDARGRLTAINRPGAAATAPFDINNRGQIVGVAGNP